MSLFKNLILLLAIMLVAKPVWSQTSEPTDSADASEEKLPKKIQEAYDAYEAKEYYDAIERLKDAFSKAESRKQKAEITFMIAESYRHIRDCRNAENQYKRAFKMKYGNEAQYQMAQMLKCQGEYEEAIKEFQAYKQLEPNDERAEIGIESSKQALEWMQSPSRYQVNNMEDLNSKQHDYGVSYAGRMRSFDEIYFGSMREESTGKDLDGWTGEAFSDIYMSNAERKSEGRRGRGRGNDEPEGDLKWSTPQPLDEVVNTIDHEGVGVFDSRKKTYYFTRCIKQRNAQLGCSIWETKKQGQSWAAPELVVLAEDSTVSVGHPALSPDDEILYFVSDMEGTLGGMDIWMTTYNRRERKWNTPKNLGPRVNTAGNERYPFIHDDGTLYFASDGLPGMGGMDIFKVEMNEEGLPAGDAVNMQYPINTNADDFNLIFEDGAAERGFLTSDRKGTRGGYDIWSVYLVPVKFTLEGILASSKDGKPIPQATVRLDGTDGTSVVVNTDENGRYFFDVDQLAEETNYKINFEKKKFLNGTADFTTVGVPFSAFEFVPSENYYLHTFNLDKKLDPIEVPIVLPNVFFDLAKWDLRPESMTALDSVVEILNNNPNITIELRSHTDYRDTDERNDKLSQKRADTCVQYLIYKGIDSDRLVAKGMGEHEPFTIPENYTGYGSKSFKAGTTLTERYIKTLPSSEQEVANQINRRTDFKVLRDDYVPKQKVGEDGEVVEATDKPAGAPKAEFYTLEPRDNWVTISKKFDISIRDLKELNGGLRGVRPFVGLTLKVTPGADYTEFDATHYQLERGDGDFKDVAKKLDLDKKDLEDLNPDLTERDFKPGLYIRIK
ncbi:MAG: OmpA family protein [Bacteroidota bacterium]|nr:OmpA family protein [Bacteroidota bacterium]MDX5446809.1 OmpA family protein [Bacteroidota bacterium]